MTSMRNQSNNSRAASEERPPNALEIRLFGPLEVRIRERTITEVRSRKAHWLLALLALRQGHPVERGWLAGTLWPESTEARAYASLRQSLADLKRALGAAATAIDAPTSHTIRIIDSVAVDVSVFRNAVTTGDEEGLARAVGLYRGALLEGCGEEWVVHEREDFTQAYLNALERLAEFAEKRGEHSAAGSYRRLAIAADPLRECAQRGLMRSLARCGDFSASIQVYRDLRMLLHDELNTEPDPETTALFRQIREDGRERAKTAGVPTPSTPADSSDRSTSDRRS